MSDHPELEQLENYLHNIDSTEFSGLRLHLAQCAQCRALAEGLMGLQVMPQKPMSQQQDDLLTDVEHQLIFDYVDGRLSGAEHQQQKDFIHSNPSALKASLHYASHKSAMDKAGLEPELESSSVTSMNVHVRSSHMWSGLQKKLKALLTFSTPVWITVPVMAAFVAILSVNLFDISAPGQANYTIASYQDNAIIQFRPKDHLPGIGFFAKSAQFSEVYDTLEVTVSDNGRFTIQWPPVVGAIKYTLRLQMFDQGNKVVLGQVTTEKTSAIITTEQDDIFHRYEWVLSGETSDNRVFLATGGFVIDKLAKGVLR